MRGMMSQIAMVVDRYGWNGALRIEDRVVTELEFWRRNLRDLNGWEMRMSDKVVYCRDGQVEMFVMRPICKWVEQDSMERRWHGTQCLRQCWQRRRGRRVVLLGS